MDIVISVGHLEKSMVTLLFARVDLGFVIGLPKSIRRLIGERFSAPR